MPHDSFVPDAATLYAWIEQVFAQGTRRPGYPADQWAEQFCLDQFRAFGLEHARLDPVQVPYWESRAATLHVEADGETMDLECMALPFSEPGEVAGELVPFDMAGEERRGKLALCDVQLTRLPPTFPVARRLKNAQLLDGAPDAARQADFCYDPRDTFTGAEQVLPFSPALQEVMEPAIAAGAIGFVGVLRGYPGGGRDYYVPYDGIERPIPGIWITEHDGDRLRALLKRGAVQARLTVDAERTHRTCHNVIAELPGADDEWVVIGTHHDGPWSSAVEDGSGIALVLAQAAYWAQVPAAERPHRLVFLITAGHMAAAAGTHGFIERYRADLERIVLEVHLEHAANEVVERDGTLVATGESEARWWFTSRAPDLEAAVWQAMEAEGLDRSLLIEPEALGERPTTDGGPFHQAGVPLVNYLTAPFYLFDSMDTMDKIHRDSLVPVTRAAIRIIESTRGVSAAAMRAAIIG